MEDGVHIYFLSFEEIFTGPLSLSCLYPWRALKNTQITFLFVKKKRQQGENWDIQNENPTCLEKSQLTFTMDSTQNTQESVQSPQKFYFSEPQFFHLQSGGDGSSYPTVLLLMIKGMI